MLLSTSEMCGVKYRMNRKIRYLIVLLVMFSGGRAGHAEPGPVGQWLMDQPASMFTVGMNRLDGRMAVAVEKNAPTFFEKPEQGENIAFSSGWAHYDWDKNRIQLMSYIYVKYQLGTDVQDRCVGLLNRIRLEFGVFEGNLLENFETSGVSVLFSQRGYKFKNEPSEWRERIDRIVELNVTIKGSGIEDEVVCIGELLEKEVYFLK
jgi:hypothetical protein